MIRQATLPLLFVLSPALNLDPAGAAEAMARRVQRAALRRAPVVLGTAAAPYEPAGRGGDASPLRRLLPCADGLEVSVITASPRILGELELLAELDRRHSVTVKVLTPVPSPLDPGPRLRAANSLAAEGITTVLLLALAAERSGRIEEELHFLLEQAREAEVHDVEIETAALRRADRAGLRSTFQRLRLEHGFPRSSAGRG
jgi:DNA repair photolyase